MVPSPKRLAHIYQTYSPLCRKDCNSIGPYIHHWWNCKIQEFWKKIQKQIPEMTDTKLPFVPEEIFLQHCFPLKILNPTAGTIWASLGMVYQTIATNWKNLNPPTLYNWHKKLWDHLLMAKLADNITQKTLITSPTMSLCGSLLYSTFLLLRSYHLLCIMNICSISRTVIDIIYL